VPVSPEAQNVRIDGSFAFTPVDANCAAAEHPRLRRASASFLNRSAYDAQAGFVRRCVTDA